MGFSLIIERTYSTKLIEKAVNDCLDDLLQDNEEKKDCYFDVENDCYLSVSEKGELIGVYQLKAVSRTVLDLHPIMLKKYRSKSNKAILKVFDWVINNCSKTVNKIIAQFPSDRINIEKFALRAGFKKEGINRESFLFNGKYLDQTMVGITVKEINEVLL